MAGESQQQPKSEPDPSVLTTDQLMRMLRAERDFTEARQQVLVQRMDDTDLATKVLSETVNRTPTAIQLAVGHQHELTLVELQRMGDGLTALRDLMTEKFSSVQVQFAERDERALRESRDNKVAVDAAFAAQKEAAAEQNKSNTLAIDKSEKATNESINKLGEAASAANRALTDKIEDARSLIAALSLQVNGIEKTKAGGQESRIDDRASASNTRAIIAFGMTLILAAIIIVGVLIAAKTGNPSP